MKIRKLEYRENWLCNVDEHSYIRTKITWKNNLVEIYWRLNEEQKEGLICLEYHELENRFQTESKKEERRNKIKNICTK